MKNKTVKNLVTASMLFATGLVLPFLTGQIPEIGNLLLPMHIPVLLCGFVCGWKYGLTVGFTLPITRSLIFGMPILYPSAVNMAFELAAYGFVTGFIYMLCRRKNLKSIYISLISAMLIGRAVKGASAAIIYGVADKAYSFSMFIGGAFVEAVPGIILQLLLIPTVMVALKRARVK
jgi:thiamine transporter ThiT